MVIVTGGAGFIGSALVAALNRRQITDILIVDELHSSAKWKNLRALRFSDYMEKQDFLDLVVDNQVPEEVETVFHLGACSSTTENDVSYLVKNNFEYTKWLALWAVESKIRFIYASSAATYGDGSQGFEDDQETLHQLRPLNPYGYSKQMFDLWARATGLLGEIVGLKYFNVFGPNEYHKGAMCSYAYKGFGQIQDTGKVRLFKSCDPRYAHGEYLRDFIYVKDAVEMTLFFMDHPAVAGIYNIGSGQARTWNDYVRALFSALEMETDIEYVEMPADIAGQYQYYTQANMEKLRNAGYDCPVMSLEEAIRDYVQNYLTRGAFLAAGASESGS